MDNYQISRDRAQSYFLGFDQDAIIRAWGIDHDENSLYVNFFARPYRICRQTGEVTRLFDNTQAGFEEVLSVFDLLCHEGECKYLSGRFAPVNSLKGRPVTVAVETDFYNNTAEIFDRNPEGFRQACLALGGTEIPMGDTGFQFPVFGDMSVILKFYHSDEDFPASLTLLWDENTLQFLFYETVFYIAGFLLKSIGKKMMDPGEK